MSNDTPAPDAEIEPRASLFAAANAITREMMLDAKERQRGAAFEAWKNIQYLRGYGDKPPAPVSQDSAPRAMPPEIAATYAELDNTMTRIRDCSKILHQQGLDDTVHIASATILGLLAKARHALEAAYAPRAVPPDLAGHIREARATAEMMRTAREPDKRGGVTLFSGVGFEQDATDIEAVCDALEAAYAPRSESAALLRENGEPDAR